MLTSRSTLLFGLFIASCTVAEDGAPDDRGPENMPTASAKEATGEIAAAMAATATFTPPSLQGSTSTSAIHAASDASAATATGSAAPASAAGSAALGSAAAGSSSGESPPPCPPDMALVNRFCVDRFEAYLLEVADDGSTKPHPYFERPVKGVTYRAVNAEGAFPQAYISRVESKAACVASGKRLCSKSEWNRACRNKGWMTYPYGAQGKKGRCNTGKLHLLTQMFKNPRGGFKYEEHFNSPDLNKTPDFLAKSGQFTECASELGVHDMVGNLHEWISDSVDDAFMAGLDSEDVGRRDQPWHTGNGVFMGGFYSTTSEHGPGCTFVTVAHEPTYHDYSTGFRCCKAADLPKPEKKSSGARASSTATGSAVDQ